ncbi:hypothetical protein CK203_099034 [Vitis vinifera]|uniref:Reverse transcriptase zinc-binding domain-containing protein n=1 Tax=Vitis vinifera TaxID=29760 RepID=A0A438D8T3_VITVI|nr:hypothetical protein CK203_099034 [Vitis vinifera]
MVVRLRLEQIQRYFLWGGGALEHKPHLCSFVVGNGRKVLFWKDRWCGDNLFVCYVAFLILNGKYHWVPHNMTDFLSLPTDYERPDSAFIGKQSLARSCF